MSEIDSNTTHGKCAHDGCRYRVQYVGGSWRHVGTFGYTPTHEAELDYSLLPEKSSATNDEKHILKDRWAKVLAGVIILNVLAIPFGIGLVIGAFFL